MSPRYPRILVVVRSIDTEIVRLDFLDKARDGREISPRNRSLRKITFSLFYCFIPNKEGSRVEATLTALRERLALFMKSFLEASQPYHKLVDGIGLLVLLCVNCLKRFNNRAHIRREQVTKMAIVCGLLRLQSSFSVLDVFLFFSRGMVFC